MQRVKSYLTFLAAHWGMTLILVLVVAVFVAGPIRALYARLASTFTFLPAARAA